MTTFRPPRCPYSDCPSQRSETPFHYNRKGHYVRLCDRRRVPRFLCHACTRRFSSQTFRLDYRQRKPWLNVQLAHLLCAKTTLRKSAEVLGVRRPAIERRLRLFGAHARATHEALLERHRLEFGGLRGRFQLDELETFERDRRLKPVTVPVLIERSSFFVVHVETAPLGARGSLSKAHREKRLTLEARFGPRRSQSAKAVQRTLGRWKAVLDPLCRPCLESDLKSSYVSSLRRVFGARATSHARYSGRLPRSYFNPLFPINHTNALLRDSLSRLVRRSWGASKLRERLEDHLWIFVVFRNYVRGITRRDWETSAAMALSVLERKLSWAELLRWRAEFLPKF